MAWPGLSFREQLLRIGQTLVDEFDAVLAQFVGYLSVQHNSNGTHGTITTKSTIAATGVITSDGNITAQNADLTKQVIIGSLVDISGVVSAGMRMRPGQGWDLFSAESALSGPRDCLFLFDGRAFPTDEVLRLEGDGTNYFLKPGTVVNAAKPVFLGRNAVGERWSEILGLIVRAQTAYYERGRSTPVGEWIAVAHAAGNFTTSGGGAWTVDAADQSSFGYMLVGKTMAVRFIIADTDVAAGPGISLQIAIPGGFTAAATQYFPLLLSDAGVTNVWGYCFVQASGTTIFCRKLDNSNWTVTAADNTSVIGSMAFEVQ